MVQPAKSQDFINSLGDRGEKGVGGALELGASFKFSENTAKVLLLPVYRRAKGLLYFSGEGYSSFLCLGKIICEPTLPPDYNKLFNLWQICTMADQIVFVKE